MSIADKLQHIYETKNAIRDAIIAKGVEIVESDTFRSYADKIASIVTSGGGGGEVEPFPVLAAEQVKGLCFWIDGQCNTRAGLDHSKDYMENLVWNVPYSKTSTANSEAFGTGNVWNGDYLKLNTYAFYPQVASEQTTIEVLFYYDSDRDTVTNGTYILCDRLSSNGWAIQGGSADAGRALLLTGADEQYRFPAREYGAINYLVVTIDTTQSKASMRVLNTGEEMLDIPLSDQKVKTSFNMGLGIAAGTSTSATSSTKNRWCGVNIGMARIWTRILSEDEIQANYQEVKKRFGF